MDVQERHRKPQKTSEEEITDTEISNMLENVYEFFGEEIASVEKEISTLYDTINKKIGIRTVETGLAPKNKWDLVDDKVKAKTDQTLQVARCTNVISTSEGKLQFVIAVKQLAKFIVECNKTVERPQEIKEGMRVGVDRMKYQIYLPLPPKIDSTVTMMEVEEKPNVTYDDIGGCDKQIEMIREVVEIPLLHPEEFIRLSVDPPKGILLYGPPGTGKTLCARAVANKTDATFIRIIGSELVQKYVGEGARLVREIFELAKSKKACIIFFDEIDSFASTRFGGGNDQEVQRTMLELINQLDGFDPRGNIKVIMATNRPDILDPALLRPGRLDRKIEFKVPDTEGRKKILKLHASSMSVAKDIRYGMIANMCTNATGAELRSVCTEAGMVAIRERRKVAKETDFIAAVNKVIRKNAKFSAISRYMGYN